MLIGVRGIARGDILTTYTSSLSRFPRGFFDVSTISLKLDNSRALPGREAFLALGLSLGPLSESGLTASLPGSCLQTSRMTETSEGLKSARLMEAFGA